nr:family 43 glycosylhydrolase [Paenibacillus phyllosphaerae]
MVSNNAIRPGQVWLDTEGKRIHAHGGSILYLDGVFYWYGENKEKSTPGNGIWHWGVRCYASRDLYNWEDKGLIIPPDLENKQSSLHPSRFMDRPHIIYNRSTKKFVCWLKVMQPDHSQKSTVLIADDILGPYTMVRDGLKPLGMSAGDFDLVVNPSDGKAYYYFERVHSELICADLTDDYTDVTGYYSTHFPQSHPPYVREAPAHFYRNGLHYLVTSGTTGYFPNPSEVACSKLYHGPFEVLGDPHVGDESNTSFHSQICSVFKHPHKKDLYIALADRWITEHTPGNPQTYEEAAAIFDRLFGPSDTSELNGDNFAPVDTSKATFVWLPFRFDGKMAYLDWKDEWRIEDYE